MNYSPAHPQQTLLEASANGELQFQAIESESTSVETTEDRRNILRVKIYQSLNEIIAAEQAEYARLDAIYQQESTLNKGLIQTGAVLTGLGQSAWGLAVWLKDVTDLVNPVVHTRQLYKASQAALASNSIEQGLQTLHAAQLRELAEVLGFDPTKVSREQIDRGMESAELIWDDPALQSALFKFAKDYASAQHSTEISHMAGAGVFEIILTVILVAVTGGAGAVANMASKARLLGKFDKLGKLLLEFADAAKAIKLAQKNKGAKANKGKASLADLDADDVSVKATSEPPAGTKGGGKDGDAEVPNKVRYVDLPNDLAVDSRGVYGYLPTSDSQFHSSKWPVDWTKVDQVSSARATRLEYHVGLEKKQDLVNNLRLDGVGDDDIARQIVEMRNQDRLSHYKTPEALEVVYQRNLAKYGNKTGPTYESQIAKYGTSTEVINAALRSNDTMDILTGIAKPK